VLKHSYVTDCHIDHVGRIPYLLAAGFDGPIYATEVTAHLLPLVIEDAIKVGVTRDARLIRLYLKKLQNLLVPVPYKQWFPVEGLSGIKAKFQVAGHILGSAYIEFDIKGKAQKGRDLKGKAQKSKSERVVFSGDLGAPFSPLLPAPKAPYRADYLVIESTYGDRLHESRRDRRKYLQQTIERCFLDGGTVLIPAFSIGRTQELLYELEEIIHNIGKLRSAKAKTAIKTKTAAAAPEKSVWDHLDIIVDSPLASKFTSSYRELKTLWDAEARGKVKAGRHPLGFESLLTIDSHSEHMGTVEYLRKRGRPAIVIAASGMCAGGRMQNYLKALLPHKRTDVLFVGYQAKGTPRRDIQRYAPNISGKPTGYVMLDGERVQINAQAHTLPWYSTHADQKDLVNFVGRMRYKPKHVRIVHGDDDAKEALQTLYQQMLPECDVVIGC
jgi:metallo-beta-lactamase family protein